MIILGSHWLVRLFKVHFMLDHGTSQPRVLYDYTRIIHMIPGFITIIQTLFILRGLVEHWNMQTIIINTTTVVFNVGIQKSITDPKIQFVTPLEIYKVQKAVSCSTIFWEAFNFTHFLREKNNKRQWLEKTVDWFTAFISAPSIGPFEFHMSQQSLKHCPY